ncbi:peptidase M4 [Streptomyces sp. CB00455]|uniref:M4 family metallopeptidase n=1 Tax=Streptomyces sp. CB00455 TaxID=1703927 RepID=UPI00093B32AC|nr:M4 family metallopeptidase [Streptomyces sp. CB00455]OKK19835.1 peptidase M4 [Streptomyces sp. CB00455]
MDANLPRPHHPVFCTVVPPHVLERVARSEDTARADAAQRTLEQDALQRTRRRINAFRGIVPPLGPVPADHPVRTVYDAGHRTRLPGTEVRREGSEPGRDASANRAYAGLGATFDLFFQGFGRHSIDDAGLALDASVHYGERYNNAFWDGSRMVFGDGDGDLFLDFTVSVDVIGHELTHGVTQYTANLDYYKQAGALNESMSDVFGSLIKQYSLGQTADQADWLIGAGLLGPEVSGVALRSMKAPGTAYDDDELGKDPQPATMDDYVVTTRDNGGVHINSGIPNHAFYVAATELGGHAWERAGLIWYDTLTGGALAQDADFADFARLSTAAAVTRYGEGGAEHQALQKAWSAVGVPSAG